MSRKRRGSLAGWWKHLPFVLLPFGLLMSEVWFKTQILHNQYRQNALRESIRQADARVDQLHDEIRELERMERVLERAPDLGLVPPNPGQVIELQPASIAPSQPTPRIVEPVLASPRKPEAKVVAAKPKPLPAEPAPVLEELEVLEPEADWIE